MPEKTIILWLADMHSGSPVSLYPDEVLHLMNGPRGPSLWQRTIYQHWREILEYVALMRQDADRLVVINMGDAVEGMHHDSKEVISSYLTDHTLIHETLMRECKAVTEYDTLYYVNGTPSHAGENEYDLATVLMAEKYRPNEFTHPLLKKTVYGKLIYAAHHGPAAGKGQARGNALRNYLKTLDYQARMTGQRVPDMVVVADKHDHIPEVITTQDGHKMRGYILPSMKLLDGYMYKVNPFAFSNIGAMVSTCTSSGIESEFLTIHVEQNQIGAL